jgi:uncharacterized membrane protein YhaH (DUF805 family)
MIAHLLSPSGRLSRRAYASTLALFFGLVVAVALLTGSAFSAENLGAAIDKPWSTLGRGLDASVLSALPAALSVPLMVVLFATAAWAAFALTARRLHDLGHSGWWSAFLAVPGVGVILMLACAILPGRPAHAPR